MKKFFVLLVVIFLSGCSSPVEISFFESQIDTIISEQGEQIDLPQPMKSGYDFLGWFLDEEYTQMASNPFSIPDSDVMLFPRWEKIITIAFGGEARNINELVGYEGDTLILPIFNPPTGYVFEGWYLDPQFKNPLTKLENFSDRDLVL
jgi:hypothetical protein